MAGPPHLPVTSAPDGHHPTGRLVLPAAVTLAGLVAGQALLAAAIILGDLAGSARPVVWLLAIDVAIGVLGCAAVPVLRRRPVAMALAFGVLAVLSPVATPAAGAATLRTAMQRPLRIACGVAAVGVVAQLLRDAWRTVSGLSIGWWLLLVLAAYAAIVATGAVVQARRAVIASLEERARRAESEQARRVEEARRLERARIAREMHDILAHRLSLAATYAGALEFRPDAPAADLSRAAGVIRASIHQALEELREVISVLRQDPGSPTVAADLYGAAPERPQPTLANLQELIEESRQAGVHIEEDDRLGDLSAVPSNVGRAAYRIVQEGLTNARKHAPGQPVRLTLRRRDGQLVIEIGNPLASDPAAEAVPGGGMGLVGLAERAHLAGGQLEHGPFDGGFRLQATLPWPG